MAKACNVCYSIGGDVTSGQFYNDIGFAVPPSTFIGQVINAALVGVTPTEIVVAFRGTEPIDVANWDAFIDSVDDWVHDGEADLVKVPYCGGQVHRGFSGALETVWSGVANAVRQQLSAKRLPVVVTGHSKGGALATLAAIRLRSEGVTTPLAVYTYGSPRVGDTPFSTSFNAVISQWRFENDNDLVPHLPPTAQLLAFLGRVDQRLSGLVARAYDHAGVLEYLDSQGQLTEGNAENSLDIFGQRMKSFFHLLLTGQIRQVATDHSVLNEYIPKICALS
jgi:hypothetical protein